MGNLKARERKRYKRILSMHTIKAMGGESRILRKAWSFIRLLGLPRFLSPSFSFSLSLLPLPFFSAFGGEFPNVCHPLRFFFSSSPADTMLVGLFCSDNRTKIVTVLLSSEIHAKCVPAAFSRRASLSALLHLTLQPAT